ncbi:MAG TPA: hypothetical protein VLG76_05920 [Rhabdochlamydiaceae bacterium]|nr:hypothetical protein [Rhabdochlamydiaceae bacterium]
MSFVHISSSGSKTRLAGPMSAQADSLLELTIDMKYLILQVQGIADPSRVDDFQIHLEDHTCTYTHPDTKKKLIFQLHDIQNPHVQELTKIYFDAARPIFVQRYHFDRTGSPINGRKKLPPNPGILKVADRFIDVNKKGFDSSTRLVAHYIAATDPDLAHGGTIRRQILGRFTFSYLMHKGLVERLTHKIRDKERDLEALPKTRAAQNDKNKLTEQLGQLMAMKTELEEMDYFAPSLVLSNFPDVSPAQGEDIDQMELTLDKKIKKSKAHVEERLRYNFEFAKAEKDQQQVAYEEHYIRNNCLGLFNLHPHTLLPHTRQHSMRDPSQHSIENIFVSDALTYDPNVYKGQGFKEYYKDRLTGDNNLKAEMYALIEGAAGAVTAAMQRAPRPELNSIAVVPYPQDDLQAYSAGRNQAIKKIKDYLAEIEQPALAP